MRLQRRLYRICLVCFLVFRVPENAETKSQALNRHIFWVISTVSSLVGNPVQKKTIWIFLIPKNTIRYFLHKMFLVNYIFDHSDSKYVCSVHCACNRILPINPLKQKLEMATYSMSKLVITTLYSWPGLESFCATFHSSLDLCLTRDGRVRLIFILFVHRSQTNWFRSFSKLSFIFHLFRSF